MKRLIASACVGTAFLAAVGCGQNTPPQTGATTKAPPTVAATMAPGSPAVIPPGPAGVSPPAGGPVTGHPQGIDDNLTPPPDKSHRMEVTDTGIEYFVLDEWTQENSADNDVVTTSPDGKVVVVYAGAPSNKKDDLVAKGAESNLANTHSDVKMDAPGPAKKDSRGLNTQTITGTGKAKSGGTTVSILQYVYWVDGKAQVMTAIAAGPDKDALPKAVPMVRATGTAVAAPAGGAAPSGAPGPPQAGKGNRPGQPTGNAPPPPGVPPPIGAGTPPPAPAPGGTK